MKKILIVVVSLISFVSTAFAKGFDVNIISNDTFSDKITIYLEVSNIDLTGSCNGLCGLVGNLEYDQDKIKLLSITPLENFELINGSKIVLYKSIGITDRKNILTLNFENLSLQNNELTTISFNNITGSDGDDDISSSNTFKTVKYVNQNITTKPNEEKEETPSKNNTSTNKSHNSNLKSLTLSVGSINFDSEILNYNVEVKHEITSLTIDGTTEDAKATVSGLGSFNLAEGKNSFEITVKAEDGTIKKYQLNVIRASKEEGIVKEKVKKESKFILPIVLFILIVIGFFYIFLKNKQKNK